MGEQFIGDLPKAFRNVTVSRKRALQIIGGVIAVAAPSWVPRSAEARKRGKPPLAFAAATVTITKNSPSAFTWRVTGAVAHPASNSSIDLVMLLALTANLTTDKVRSEIVAGMKTSAVSLLRNQGQTVAKDRIAVTLL